MAYNELHPDSNYYPDEQGDPDRELAKMVAHMSEQIRLFGDKYLSQGAHGSDMRRAGELARKILSDG